MARKYAEQRQKEAVRPAAAPAPAAKPPRTAPGEEGLGQVLVAAHAHVGEQILEVRCVERYGPLASDEGRYEVKTATRTLTAIRSRLGEVTFLTLALALLGNASAFGADADPTVPRGPSEWTARNWMGLCIQIGLFVLALWGIWKLVEDPEGKGTDQSGGGNASASS